MKITRADDIVPFCFIDAVLANSGHFHRHVGPIASLLGFESPCLRKIPSNPKKARRNLEPFRKPLYTYYLYQIHDIYIIYCIHIRVLCIYIYISYIQPWHHGKTRCYQSMARYLLHIPSSQAGYWRGTCFGKQRNDALEVAQISRNHWWTTSSVH